MGIVTTLPESAVDYMLYGDKSHIVSDYLQRQLTNIPQVFNQFTQRVHAAVTESYRHVTNALTKSNIIHQLTHHGLITTQDYMQTLSTFEQLQNASPVMQRWIMSHPKVKSLYLNQNIDGYSETYVNHFGSGVAEQDYNWRRVMSGVQQDDGKQSWRTFYDNDDLMEGDRALEHFEKVIVLSTYNTLDILLKDNPYDFSLKSEALMKINWD
jgi:hypothetical protein